MLSRAVVQQKAQIEERVPPKMTLKSSPLVWSLAFMAAFLALTKETATKETEVHPYSIFIQHPSDPGSSGGCRVSHSILNGVAVL